MSGVLSETFDVVVNDVTYTFKIPTIKQDIEIAYRAADVRRRAFPSGGGAIELADNQAYNFSRYCAIMELYLVKCSSAWPYGIADDDVAKMTADGPAPKVDFEKFSASRTNVVYQVGAAFDRENNRFREPGNPV